VVGLSTLRCTVRAKIHKVESWTNFYLTDWLFAVGPPVPERSPSRKVGFPSKGQFPRGPFIRTYLTARQRRIQRATAFPVGFPSSPR